MKLYKIEARLSMSACFLVFLSLFSNISLPILGQTSTIQTEKIFASKLELRQKIEKDLTGGQSHSYDIEGKAGEAISVIVEQRGIDVLVAIFSPAGAKIAEVDSPNGANGPEPLFVIFETTGNYRIEVRSLEKTAPQGDYEINLVERRTATEQDRKKLTAASLYAEATSLYSKAEVEAYKLAIAKYSEAIPILHEIGDYDREASALQAIGACHFMLGNIELARDFYQKTLDLRRLIKDKKGEAEALNNLANIYSTTGEKTRAIEYLNNSLQLMRETGDRPSEGVLLNNIGFIYADVAEDRKAIEYFKQSLEILRATGNRYTEVSALGNIGKSYIDLGEPQTALEYFQQSLNIARSMGERNAEAYALTSLGTAYLVLGDAQRSIKFELEALELVRKSGNRSLEAAILTILGDDYYALGNFQKTLEYFQQALTTQIALKDMKSAGQSYKTIGLAHKGLGEYSKALEAFDKALPINRSTKDIWGEAITLGGYAQVYEATRDYARASDFYRKSAELLRGLDAKRNLAVMLYAIAHVESERGNYAESLKNLEEGIAINEHIRASILSSDLRSSYRGSVNMFYELYVDVLMNLHKQNSESDYSQRAFQANEKSRARTLLELLAESRTDLKKGVPAELLQRERALRQEINENAAKLSLMEPGKNSDEKSVLRKEMDLLTARYEQAEAEICKANPRYSELVQSEAISIKTIQNELIDNDTVLLEYSLGEKQSYLWIISPSSFKSFVLPKRAVIEEQARKVYQTLTSATDQNERISANEAAKLSEIVLAPAAAEIKNKRLLIVADGSLQYVSFAALPNPNSIDSQAIQTANSKKQLLIESNEIIVLPSASVLAELRRKTIRKQSAPLSVAVFADPVFSPDDTRLKAITKQNNTGMKTVVRSETELLGEEIFRRFDGDLENQSILKIPRLPFSRREANNILSLVPDDAEFAAFDFKANLSTANNQELAKYRILHFATHGLLNSANPELSGIVLSLVNEKGEPQNGFLRLNDIYNLRLNSDLVVLSACQTALGKDIRGEGLIGLTRGFMYAGTPRVVASLWKVDDAATAELMKRFYANMLQKKLPPAEALRSAQIEMSKDERYKSPYYWAAFTLQGEWR